MPKLVASVLVPISVISALYGDFVGYEEHRLGWRVHDLAGKYSFSNDVIFNENLPAHLGIPHSIPLLPLDKPISPPHLPHECLHIRMAARQAYDDVMEL